MSPDRIPRESVLIRALRHRFDDDVREFIKTGVHYVVKRIHDRDLCLPVVRPESEVVTPRKDPERIIEDDQDESFTDEQIYRTTRLARKHGFEGFDSERAPNATYSDTQFFELQTYMGMTRCGTAQGATRFQYRRGQDYGPHGDTHLRAVKQFDIDGLTDGFEEAMEQLLSAIASEASFRRPVTVALDITTVPYYVRVHTQDRDLAEDVTAEWFADRIDDAYSGADIAAICEEAAMIALREDVEDGVEDENEAVVITREQFLGAIDEVDPIGKLYGSNDGGSGVSFQ